MAEPTVLFEPGYLSPILTAAAWANPGREKEAVLEALALEEERVRDLIRAKFAQFDKEDPR